ncbi:FadR family transcriptional regulator [Ramlibacter rhizophilus]|uniref:FadR family transcriptional regulator n=2 Tax=Ramlibacter rhizophilus TaxID=1781167 RepID=A0A4Z0BL20_9BURK|nr:FadR family transcriptional regulator [Ramlibacter rhizophilus]
MHGGQWRSADRLPTERALSEQFGLSRGSVRKVLQELRDMGLISQTVGSGTYVTEQAPGLLASMASDDPLRHTSPAELMEARLALEPAILEMVVGNATPADFRQMEECCARAEAAGTLEEFEHWDGRLHEVIAQAAHNSFVASVFRLMNQVRSQTEWGALKRRSVTPERRAHYQGEHRQLVRALQARDLDLARSVATEHLVRVRRNMLNY